MPGSVSQYVLKVSSRCDLSCDHCYVYELADQSWRGRPKALDVAAARQAATRIAEHARAHRLDEVHVVLHGGEPLLLGAGRLRGILRTLRTLIDTVTRLDLRIHTNGVLLDETLCELFADYGVHVGVSLDGDRAANDLHRRYSDGRSSHEQVLRALTLLRKPEYRYLYAGILCTVDVANDPIAVYEALLAEAPPRIDLLLPHATWDEPPPRPEGRPTPYAAWLGRFHDRWVADGRPVPVRLFDSLLAAWDGRRSGTEAAGLDPVDLLVIETDGAWEQADSLKAAFDGAPATGFNVWAHSVDEAAAHPGVAARRSGLAGLCQACRDCHLVRACGGGLYAHRYKSDNGFDNPSVYCDDLKALIPRITERPKAPPSTPGPDCLPTSGHGLPEAAFDLLAAGPGDRWAMASLADAHSSVNRALVAAAASRLDDAGGDLRRAAEDAWKLLSWLDAEHPSAVREVLTYPYVQFWATQCLRPGRGEALDLDRAHLAGVAAAAAMRAGVEAELILPVRLGAIFVPAVGAIDVEDHAGCTSAVRVSPSGLSCRHATGARQAVRAVDAGEMSLTVDDVDPFRDSQAWAAARRLSPAEWRAWRTAVPAAARQLAAEVPAYAGAIAAGLRSVVPLRTGPAGQHRSATARQAFGAIALLLPRDVDTLSVLLVHEMQHVKLTALCDMFDLFDKADPRRFRVSWRADPRPLEGLLHGTYAHLAIAELWRSRTRKALDGDARHHFLMYRSWVEEAIGVLLNAGTLTPAGERFVNGMRSTVETWTDDR
jgi:uncharacterized protein